MNIIYTNAYLSIICLWVFNMILTRYSRDCRLFVFKVRDDTFVDIVYPFMLLSVILEAMMRELQFYSLTPFANFIMDLICAMTLCRFIIGKMSRQARNDIADMSAEHQKIRDCTEGELNAMFANAEARLANLRKELEALATTPATKYMEKVSFHPGMEIQGYTFFARGGLPIYIEKVPSTNRQILLVHSEWFNVFMTEMLNRPKTDSLYQHANGPIIVPTRGGNFLAERQYTTQDAGEPLSRICGSFHRLQAFGYQWNPSTGAWENVEFAAIHLGKYDVAGVNEALITYLCDEKSAIILDLDSVADVTKEYRKYIRFSDEEIPSTPINTCVGVEEVQEFFYYENHAPILISKNVPYDSIMMVPNGWWNEFKRHMTTVYKNSHIHESEFGPWVIPTFGHDLFAEREYCMEVSSTTPSTQVGVLTVHGYKWDPKVYCWQPVSITVRQAEPGGSESEINAALYHHLTVKRPVQISMNRDSDVFRVYSDFERNLITAAGGIRAVVGDDVQAPLSREIICVDCKPFVDRAGVEVFLPSENGNTLVILNKHYIDKLIVPAIKFVLSSLNTGQETINKYFRGISFVSVNEGMGAQLDFTHRTEDGHLEQLFTWPVSDSLFDGPLMKVIRYEPHADGTWFSYSQVPTVVRSRLEVLSRADLERYINEEIIKFDTRPLTKFLDFAFEHIPFVAPNTTISKSWRASLITQQCFDQLKANTSILREHYFVDETGKPYLFKDNDGHEEFYNALRNRLWCVVPSDMSIDFELSTDMMHWVHQGEQHNNANVRLTAFKCYRLTYNTNWVEEWQPFIYEINSMDGMGLKVAILNSFLDFPKQPRCFTKLSEILRVMLPEDYYKYHCKVDK